MALTEVLRSDTFEQWRTKTNTVSSDLGDRATLSANITANTSLVGAINELQSDIGVIGSLSTFAASNVVAALNELKTGSSVTISGTKTFSSNLNLSSGQAYTIDGTSVLNATTLGSGVVNSSLTTVGTIGTGTWQGTIISPTYGGTGINNGSRTLTISTGNLALTTAAGGSSLTLPASGTVATLAGNETLTTKTINLSSNTLTGTLAQFNAALSDDDFAGLNTAQTLLNKTIALGSNTISGTLAQFNTALTDDDFAALAAAQTLTNKSLQDSTTFFIDETTPTKRLQFQLSGISANTTRTLTIPDNSGTIALTSDTTFIGTTSISLSRGSGNLALAGISSVTLPGSTSGTVVLQPVAVAGTTTITLPATTGTVVTTGDSGTVTNTMLAGSIANAKLSNSSVTFNGVTVALGSSGTITSTTTNTLTIGDGLSGTSFNGSAAVTIAADATIARRADTFSIGTTSVALNRTSGSLALTGISSIDFPTAGTNVIKLTPASTNALVTLTMPAQTGTIVTTGDTGTVTNTMLAGSITNGKLVNSSVTIGSTAVSLGSTVTTFTGLASVTSSAFSGPLTGNVTGNLTGNADTATKLATARTINGVSFDGTANITVTAAAGTLTGTTLNSTVVTSSLTSVGTIGAGVWQGTSIGTAYTDAKIVSVAGTANQITATTTTGAVALSLPQNIHTGATPTFASVTANNVVLGSAANTISTSTASTNLTLTSTGGTVAVSGNETVSGTLDVSGRTRVLTALADNSVIFAARNTSYTNESDKDRVTIKTDGTVEIKGNLIVRGATTIDGTATVSANFDTLSNKPSPVVGVTLSGDMSGSASTTLTSLGAGTYTIALASTIADNAVIASKIAADAVTTAKILNGNVTNAKLANSSITVTTAGGSGLSGGAVVNLGETVTLTNTDKGSSQSIFKNIAIAGTTSLTANANNDILNFATDGTLSITASTAGGNKTVNIVHATMGSQASVDNSGGTVIQDVTLNNGHVTGLTSVNLDTRFAPINTETLDSVTTRGATTANGITVGSLTTSGAISAATLTLSGDLVVNGTTTTINSSTVTVDDKNIELGSASAKTGLVATLSTGTAAVTLVTGNTTGMIVGQTLTKTTGAGAFGASPTVASITSLTQFTVSVNHATAGSITFDVGAVSDATANGGGITLRGATDKTITWDSANTNWTSSENWNIATGKTFKIANSEVLSSTTVLGVGLGATQTANTFLAAPNGSNGLPTFRTISAADIPTLNQNTSGSAGSVAQSITFAASGGALGTTTFNGSVARTIDYSTVGAAAASHTHPVANISDSTIVGQNLVKLANPGAITFLRVNANNTVDTLDAATFRGAIGAGTGNGIVSSITTTGTFAGLTLTPSGTTAVTLTLGGTFSAPIANINDSTTVGQNLVKLTNPGAIAFLRVNADNTVSTLDATNFRTAIGAGTGNGTVTSVSGSGTVAGITLGGSGTTTASLTLSGTLSTPVSTINDSTTVGQNLVKLTNPGAITFLRINADNTVSALTDAQFRTAIGAGTSSTNGTVTTVSASGPLAINNGGSTTPNVLFLDQAPNKVLAGPVSGPSNAYPTFRSLDTADIPALDAGKITTGTFDTARIPALSQYLTTSAASSTYATQTSLSSYLTTAAAASTYATQTSLSSYLTTTAASTTYQPKDADLTAIAGLSGTSGLLRKTAADTWTLDTAAYLSSVPNLQSVCNAGSTTSTSITAGSFIKSGAFSTDILKGDGSTESDSNYVKTSGVQTIGGTKVFSANVGIGTSGLASVPLHINLTLDPSSLAVPPRSIWARPTFRLSNTSNTGVEGIQVQPTVDTAFWGETTSTQITYKGIRIGGVLKTGTTAITETVGLYIDNSTQGTTNNYAIYSAHTGASVFSGSLTATSLVKSGGNNTQFLKADGSVDSNTYLTSSTGVTSITGTTNQITASASTGSVTLSLPQSINTGASVQFGSIGVGTAASGVSGEIRAIDNITAYYTSDERLKTNVRKIENALDKVTQINGVVYDWNDTYKKSHGDVDGYFVRNDNSGIIAQEVEKVFPNVVGERQDGFKAVRYELLVPLLIEAIKDLKAEIEALKAK